MWRSLNSQGQFEIVIHEGFMLKLLLQYEVKPFNNNKVIASYSKKLELSLNIIINPARLLRNAEVTCNR
jgi:hypothetical protein